MTCDYLLLYKKSNVIYLLFSFTTFHISHLTTNCFVWINVVGSFFKIKSFQCKSPDLRLKILLYYEPRELIYNNNKIKYESNGYMRICVSIAHS